MTIGEYIAQARKDRGLSQRALGKAAGLSAAEITRIENNQRKNPSPVLLRRIADALLLDLDDLMRMAGYIPEEAPAELELGGYLRDRDGNLRKLKECAEEMYRVDRDLLQAAYLASHAEEKTRRFLTAMIYSALEMEEK